MKFTNISFEPIHEKCQGCENIIPSKGRLGMAKCKVYWMPRAWWRHGSCPLATHLEAEPETALAKKTRVGQQKSRKGRTR